MKVTICPPKAERKPRRQETRSIRVVWKQNDMMYFRHFKRDKHAMEFQQELILSGIDMWDIRVFM